MPIETEQEVLEIIETDDVQNEIEKEKRTTVSVRFALGKSGGIHVVPQKPPKNLPEARKGALRYAKTQ